MVRARRLRVAPETESASTSDALPEQQRNSLLRRVDWRFLLRQSARPRALNLASGRLGEAVSLVFEPAEVDGADLVVLGCPKHPALVRAREALRPGGELYCECRVPRLGGVSRARRALSRAGFDDIRILWPGPRATRPQFWLPLDSPAASDYLLAERPPQNRRAAALRWLWKLAAQAGALAPMCVLARRSQPGGDPGAGGDELALITDGAPCGQPPVGRVGRKSWLLLTTGERSINKVVGLRFGNAEPVPALAVKFARVPEAEPYLRREAEVLRMLEKERPAVPGVPRILGTGRRGGELAVVETAVYGSSLMSALTPAAFPRLAAAMTHWLVELAGTPKRHARSDWWTRLVQEPLQTFEHQFGAVVGESLLRQARERLSELQSLPIVFEHRDCSPWNIVLTASGAPGLLDWESAEPRGLPALDLVYFLATSAFVLDGALETGSTREAYARVLGSDTAPGRVAAECLANYCQELDLDAAVVSPLRLLTWIVHSRSDFRHAQLDSGGSPMEGSARIGPFVSLVEEELTQAR